MRKIMAILSILIGLSAISFGDGDYTNSVLKYVRSSLKGDTNGIFHAKKDLKKIDNKYNEKLKAVDDFMKGKDSDEIYTLLEPELLSSIMEIIILERHTSAPVVSPPETVPMKLAPPVANDYQNIKE